MSLLYNMLKVADSHLKGDIYDMCGIRAVFLGETTWLKWQHIFAFNIYDLTNGLERRSAGDPELWEPLGSLRDLTPAEAENLAYYKTKREGRNISNPENTSDRYSSMPQSL
ncbi:MAG: hypothetical protein Q8P81_02865 [Nanoarchaeota archaeon]|nr:hypothetical protein [Nanoarchaeota archaeon]